MSQELSVTRTAVSRRQMLRLIGLGGAAALVSPLLPRSEGKEPGPAPSLKGSQPGYYRFQIGDIEAVAVSDGGIATPLTDIAWWAGVPNEQVSATLDSAFEPRNQVRLAMTVLLLRVGNELVLVDSGCGGLFGPAGGHLIKNLSGIGIEPDQISAVIVSHLHGDHFGGLLDAQRKPAFPNAKLFLHDTEHAFWSKPSPDVSHVHMPDAGKKAAVDNAHNYLEALKDRWQLVKGGQELFPGVKTVDAPGHTPGHMALEVSSNGESLLHIADAAHHHAISYEHPDWAFAADVQPELAQQTRRALLERVAKERLRIFGSHMPFPSLGHVRRGEGHFEYVIEPWVSS